VNDVWICIEIVKKHSVSLFHNSAGRETNRNRFAWSGEPSKTDHEVFEMTLAELRSSWITSANVRCFGNIQFSPGSTSLARVGESGNHSGWAFFHLAKATLFAISRSFT
jgi:hypothetical protein